MFSVWKKIWLDSCHIYDHFFVVDSEEFDIVFTFESQNGVRARPFWGQFRVFPQEVISFQQDHLLDLKRMLFGFVSSIVIRFVFITGFQVIFDREISGQ